eukprot:3649899-Amphidinium_carterae.1
MEQTTRPFAKACWWAIAWLPRGKPPCKQTDLLWSFTTAHPKRALLMRCSDGQWDSVLFGGGRATCVLFWSMGRLAVPYAKVGTPPA